MVNIRELLAKNIPDRTLPTSANFFWLMNRICQNNMKVHQKWTSGESVETYVGRDSVEILGELSNYPFSYLDVRQPSRLPNLSVLSKFEYPSVSGNNDCLYVYTYAVSNLNGGIIGDTRLDKLMIDKKSPKVLTFKPEGYFSAPASDVHYNDMEFSITTANAYRLAYKALVNSHIT